MATKTAILIVDVQNDFTEGGAMGVAGGKAVARAVTEHLAAHRGEYDLVIASRDWHNSHDDNGGHFADGEPDFVTNWPVHCVADTPGAEFEAGLDISFLTHQVKKGQGAHGYSAFEGVADGGQTLVDLLTKAGIERLDVVGIATDHCVRASSLDAVPHVPQVRVLTGLIAGVGPASSQAALEELTEHGVVLV